MRLLLALVLFTPSAALAQPKEDGKAGREEPPVETVTVADSPDLLVRLVVKPRTSLADRDWLAFEFVNRGKQPLAIANARYRIGCVAKGRVEKTWLCQTAFDGGSRELFPKTWKPGAKTAVVLKPGETYRVSEHLSDLGASWLGLAPRGGLDVACTLSMDISTTDKRVFEVPGGGLPFAFQWVVPDEAGLKAVRDRLQEMLKNPVDEDHHHSLLRTFLRTEEVAKAASRDDLLAALKRRKGRFDGRRYVADALLKNHDAAKEVVAFYEERLRAKELTALAEVHVEWTPFVPAVQEKGLWSPSYIPAVADFYGPNPWINATVLEVLHRHRADWLKAPDEVKKLLARMKKEHPTLEKDPKDLKGEELEKWAMAVRDLGLVADPSAVAMLQPALEDKRVWRRPDSAFSSPSPLIRVCDIACESILTILDGKRPDRPLLVTSLEDSVKEGGFEPQTEAEFIADRDAMIEALRKRLADRAKGGK
jgi:hypothetical protein